MSTYWGYRCKTDGATSPHWLNRGEDTLCDCLRAYPGVKIIRSCGLEDPRVPGDQGDGAAVEIWNFLEEHEGHELELFNEYGKSKPIGWPPQKPKEEEKRELFKVSFTPKFNCDDGTLPLRNLMPEETLDIWNHISNLIVQYHRSMCSYEISAYRTINGTGEVYHPRFIAGFYHLDMARQFAIDLKPYTSDSFRTALTYEEQI